MELFAGAGFIADFLIACLAQVQHPGVRQAKSGGVADAQVERGAHQSPAAPVRWAISTHLIKLRMVCMTSFVSLFTEIMVKASNYNRIFLGTTHSIVRAERKYQTNFKK